MNQVRPPASIHFPIRTGVSFGRSYWLWALILGLLTAYLTSLVVGDFTHPLSDGNDTDQYEYVGYFFNKNVSLWPFPHLSLVNTQTFYPYGTNQVFLDWGFERDYWYASCRRLFDGSGPYLQYYYVYSLVVTSVGTFLLLVSRFGVPKSFIAGLVVSVFNFYALWKYPVHMNVCVAHWTVLCMVATYRLLVNTYARRPVSLSYVLFWVALHVLVLGQELAYVAGFALTFTTLVMPVILVTLYRQYPIAGQWPLQIRRYLEHEFDQQRGQIIGVLALIMLSLWLYLPLTLQIAFTAWQFDFGIVPELRAWSHPARLLLPHLPGIDSISIPYQRWLHDTFESYGQGSPGLYVTILAGVGWWQIRHKVALWLPIVGMLILCLVYHPVLVPTLKLFPWFSFNRHGGRASLIYPVLLTLLALPVRWPNRLASQVCCALLVILMGMEWYTGYSRRLAVPVNVASASILHYCAVVKQQPGDAVLDWPFCTIGANGVGEKEGLCPYYTAQNAVFTFRRFYDKSVVGQYFGRLHPDQVKPFLRDGWPRMLTPDRAFTAQDWQFLDSFLRKNNFAGINLYLDLLSPQQRAQFYQHYGTPIAETRFPAAGRVVFIALKR
ncbi:hypothetical protein [Spirosoma radiotolerans]|uniref:Glycosyltransferase RgtA/B/C/D-like domain-containing protein n=1 Tax=Spirosoma radiotolerans TaxID=1379870 RepID=A0A0E3V6V1_9BACT|nr:hypothetical protein [Spirosoma radiotolerans]AKD55352.1 hypothetical protein SD10_11035 [Spirosoma radiotolerans]